MRIIIVWLFIFMVIAELHVGVNGADEIIIAVTSTGDGGEGGGPKSYFIAGDIEKGDFQQCRIPMLPYPSRTNKETLKGLLSNAIAVSMGNNYMVFDDFVGDNGPHHLAIYDKTHNMWVLTSKTSFDASPMGYAKISKEKLFVLFNSLKQPQTGFYGVDGQLLKSAQQQQQQQQPKKNASVLDELRKSPFYNSQLSYHTVAVINTTHLMLAADDRGYTVLFYMNATEEKLLSSNKLCSGGDFDSNERMERKICVTCAPPNSAVCSVPRKAYRLFQLYQTEEPNIMSIITRRTEYLAHNMTGKTELPMVSIGTKFLLGYTGNGTLDFYTWDACAEVKDNKNSSARFIQWVSSYTIGKQEDFLGIFPVASKSIFACNLQTMSTTTSTSTTTTTVTSGYTSTIEPPPMTSGATRAGGNGSWNLSPQVAIIIILGVYAILRI